MSFLLKKVYFLLKGIQFLFINYKPYLEIQYTIVIVYTSIFFYVVETLSLIIFKIKFLLSNMKAIYTFTLYIIKVIDD